MKNYPWTWILVAWLGGLATLHCGPHAGARTTTSPGETPADSHLVLVDSGGSQTDRQALAIAMELIERQRYEEAMKDYLDPLILAFEQQYSAPALSVVCSRDQGMGMIQGLLAAAETQRDSVVLGPDWPDALYLKSVCLLELGNVSGSEAQLRRALDLMPGDIMYLCELGHVRQLQQDWTESLDLFQQALEEAELLVSMEERAIESGSTPPAGPPLMTPTQWASRALRGIGMSQIERGMLDEAEQAFRRVLELEPGHPTALNELGYIEHLRSGGSEVPIEGGGVIR
ncbi:MAG: tetratricopeptide repeat protein [Deltaproteobacteria bacterium]|nr:tetratricopeptide repeat protein [Deltaproteobacteria bacterium]